MAEDLTAALAKEVRLNEDGKVFRLGVVTALNVLAVPQTIEIDGRQMRFLGNINEFYVGDTVVWVNEGATSWALGPLANGADTGWGQSIVTHREGGLIGSTVAPSAHLDLNLYPVGRSLNVRARCGFNVDLTVNFSFPVGVGAGAQAVEIDALAELDTYDQWRERRAESPGEDFVMSCQFYREFAGPDSSWQPKVRITVGSGSTSLVVVSWHAKFIGAGYSFRALAF